MAEAELLITPEMDRKAMTEALKTLNRAMKKSAKDAGEDLEKEVEKGLTEGGKKGSSGMLKGMKAGVAGLAVAVAGAVVAGFAVAGEKVEQATGAIDGLLGDGDARDMVNFSKMQGMSTAQMAGFNSRVAGAGGDNQMARDFLVDTSEYVAQAKAGENQLLANFTNVKGGASSQFNALLASMADATPEQRNKLLADIGWAGDSSVISGMLAGLNGKTGDDAFQYLEKQTAKDKKRGKLIEREAVLETQYADKMREMNVAVKGDQLSALSGSKLDAMIKGKKAQADRELQNIIDYEKNLKSAEVAKKAQETLDKALLAMANGITETVIPWFVDISTTTPEEEAERSQSAIVRNESGTVSGSTRQTGTAYTKDKLSGRVIRR